MKIKLFIIFSVIILTGCVSTKNVKIEKDVAEQMIGKSMVTTISEKPDFAAMTAGKAMFAMVGTVAMINEGNRIVRENDIDDPAHYISGQLAEDLSNGRSLKVSSTGNIEASDNIVELATKYSDQASL